MHELITVVIPCYNATATDLESTLGSVLDQTWDNIEIIVVDDGSSLPFAGLPNKPQYLDKTIHWLSLPNNLGPAAARNAGVDEATGEFLAFLDCGDWWEPSKLEAQVTKFRTVPGCGLIYCSTLVHYRDRVELLPARTSRFAYQELLVGQPITGSASSVLIPRSAFKLAGGFYIQQDIPEDRDLWLRIARHYRVSYVQEALVHLSWDPMSRSRDPLAKAWTYERFLYRHESEIRQHGLWKKAKAHFHIVISRKFFSANRPIRSFMHFSLATLWSPRFVVGGFLKQIRRRLFHR